jgi:Bacteriocin-protection, YdeI or OmpD-Associated/Domain of unknown function (DUF1905)
MPHTFHGQLQDNPPGILVEVPAAIVEALGAGKRPAVRVLLPHQVELRTHIAVYGGKSYLGFRRDIRDKAELVPGQAIELTIELDEQPRTVDLPDDLASLLDAVPQAHAAFERLSFTNRQEYATWITSAKKSETRAKRLAEVPELLERGVHTPLGGTSTRR